MNQLSSFTARRVETVIDRLLKLVAIKVELPPSYHALACERKAALETHIQRAGSVLENLVALFYIQGSMAIGATIRARHREDGYDIDIVVELRLPRTTPPNVVLDLLFQAVRGEPGSRYYECTRRQTRCVTIEYADGMHVDLTPSILVEPLIPRRSVIPHAKPEEPRHRDRMVRMNAWGFAEEFNLLNPPDMDFAEAYAELRKRMDVGIVAKDADSEPVPPHSSEVGGKSTTVVALQLIKRNRMLRYRLRDGIRMPPSVMISCLVLEAARPGRTLTEALTESVDHLRRRLRAAQDARVLLDVRNPRDPEDRFTDRWPATLEDQRLFLSDLDQFARRLDDLQRAQTMKERSDILAELFGEAPGRDAVAELAREVAPFEPPTTRPASPASATLAAAPVLLAPRVAPAQPVQAPRNTNYGGTWPEK